MPAKQTTRKNLPGAGRPPLSPDGARKQCHFSLSQEAIQALDALCVTDIAPINKSAVIEHLILHARAILQHPESP